MNAQNRMPKQHSALISRRILALHGTRYPGLSIGSPWRSLSWFTANVLAATMEKDEALTTIVKLKIRRQHYCHARSQSLAQFRFSKSWTSISYPWQRRGVFTTDEQLREFIESAQIPFLPMSWRKGSWKIRIHFLRQLRVRFPGKCWRCHACWCTTELVTGDGKKGWAADTQFIQLDIEPQKLTATAPLLCQSLAILHPVWRYAGRTETKHIYDSTGMARFLNIHKQQNAQKMHEKLSTDLNH